MKKLTFISSLRSHLEKFVELKRLSGTDYDAQTRLLTYFDQFLVKQKYVNTNHLTEKIVESYFSSKPHLLPRTFQNRFSVVRQFCCYLSQFNQTTYVPEAIKMLKSSTSRIPYIFNKPQLESLLFESKELPPKGSLRPHTFYTLFGLLYTTGLRIGEALALKIEDFYQDTRMLYVRNGKFRKSRWVPVSPSTSSKIKTYITLRKKVRKTFPNSLLFVSTKNDGLHQSTVYSAFAYLLEQCQIKKDRFRGPRIVDLRHTFAVHRIIEWYQAGEDVQNKLPSLATYMGHVNICSTQVYLQATAELLEQGNKRFLKYFRQNISRSGGYDE